MIHVGYIGNKRTSSVRGAAHVLGSHITVVMDVALLERNIYLGRPISATIAEFVYQFTKYVLV